MRELKKQLYMRWNEMLLLIGLEAGMFLLGEIFSAAGTPFFGEGGSVFELGAFLALLTPLASMMFLGCSLMSVSFNMGVSMGAVRRRLVPMILLVTYLECLAVTGGAYLLHRLELWKIQVFYKGMENELDLGGFFRWKYILAVCLVIVALQAVFGALYVKYGKAAFWILWGVYMVAMIGLPRAGRMLKACGDTAFGQAVKALLDFFNGVTENLILAGITGICIIIIFISYLMLRKQRVTT